ncbi:YtzI protein [Bacillus sp. ISL-18]|uniref:YtzI protein n=1 Tax=Bacillus sp. ISL-18 TaxID=2819118 RepID=UPI001BEB39E1|nr:YtzI protein [Bacillus sp. ISL-18]MBT2657017.1 YtzI protein [Bacillus sp. ISL-18]
MYTVLVLGIIIVIVVLLLAVTTTSKAYSYKHTVDSLEDNPYRDQEEKLQQTTNENHENQDKR